MPMQTTRHPTINDYRANLTALGFAKNTENNEARFYD
jgi:hypothetical protein